MKWFCGVLLVVALAVTFPAMGYANTLMDRATLAAGKCLTVADKDALRSNVAMAALKRAQRGYIKTHDLVSESGVFDEAVLYSPAAMHEYLPVAVKAYRTYLVWVGYRLIVSRGQDDCTRAVIALVNKAGDFHFVSEEQLLERAEQLLADSGTDGGGDSSSSGAAPGGTEDLNNAVGNDTGAGYDLAAAVASAAAAIAAGMNANQVAAAFGVLAAGLAIAAIEAATGIGGSSGGSSNGGQGPANGDQNLSGGGG
jgi:hypothetical protein